MTRYGFTVGINDYPGTGLDLRGCVNDAIDWTKELEDRKYEVTQLLDAAATSQEIKVVLTRLIDRARYGSTIVMTFSGHGTWMADRSGDEPDGRDEALCTYDIMENGPLLDDELYTIFASRRHGVRMVFIVDACHSGTVNRVYQPPFGDCRYGQPRFLPPSVFLPDSQLTGARAVESVPPRGKSRAGALLLAGCRDFEFSYDTEFYGRPNGAFTRKAIDALSVIPPFATYSRWLRAIYLPTGNFPQTPQFQGTSNQRRWTVFD